MRWSLRNDDDDGSENGKRAIGLDKQNNVARASRFFVHFSAVAARLLRARGGTAIYGLCGYVPLWRVWYSNRVYKSERLGLESKGIIFQENDQLVEDFI